MKPISAQQLSEILGVPLAAALERRIEAHRTRHFDRFGRRQRRARGEAAGLAAELVRPGAQSARRRDQVVRRDIGQSADLVAPKLGVVQEAGQKDELGEGHGTIIVRPSPLAGEGVGEADG